MGRGGGGGGGRGGGFRSGGSRGFSSRSSGGSRGGGSAGRGGVGGYRPTGTGAPRSPGGRGVPGAGMPGRQMSPPPRPVPPPPRPRRRIWPIFLPFGRTWYGGSYRTYGTGTAANSTGPSVDANGNYTPPPYTEPSYGEKRGGIPGWYKFLCVILLIVAVVLLWNASKAASVAKSAGVAREKLGSDACTASAQWIGDELDWIRDTKTVTNAMQYFYDETGVQPYLLICDNMGGAGARITDTQAESWLADLYDSLYDDEGHMIFAFMEYQTSRYITYIYTGVSADTVIDEDAQNTFLDYADRYYTDQSLSDEEYFAKIFREAADSIMADPAADSHSAMIYALFAVAILVILAVGLIAFKIQEKKVEEARELRDIIDTPIPKSPEEEELERKYGADTTK